MKLVCCNFMHKAELVLLAHGGRFTPPRPHLQLSLRAAPANGLPCFGQDVRSSKCERKEVEAWKEREVHIAASGGPPLPPTLCTGDLGRLEQVIDVSCSRERGIKWEKM